MDPETRAIYEAHAEDWVRARGPRALQDGRVDAFAARVRQRLGPQPPGWVADLGCGPAWYAEGLRNGNLRAFGLDLSRAMLAVAARERPGVPTLCADLARLPLARGCLAGALAINSYCHLPAHALPLALAHLHDALRPGAPIEITLPHREALEGAEVPEGDRVDFRSDQEFAGRLFCAWSTERARELLLGAGFEQIELEARRFWLILRATRAHTLPDFVRPGLRGLFVGLNPSLYAAECGVPFGRPGNRFWPALEAAGLYDGPREPLAALGRGFGFSDLVKRATSGARALAAHEYADGVQRMARVIEDHEPAHVCFIGLDGWRRSVDAKAGPGPIEGGFAGRPAYLMPSTSGLNAHTGPADFVAHLLRAFKTAAERPEPQ